MRDAQEHHDAYVFLYLCIVWWRVRLSPTVLDAGVVLVRVQC
ncbi:hypothetical protein HMPREF9565_01611 [Cutibacterium acnes HL053PA2]|uniref:Uncharacterized protein n=1 Tax=Cutibacterium modestum HL044PA1 TaxID=765109 RepID=A0ABP2KA05_9ACTN|nr:hypothetical protein HMPREF1034_0469 [Cutibacterium acnes SK187]EFS39950.1 hypothetical protein HMPREF9575_01831 [Cutibacterium acnes HL110PA1]EFS42904.1 hypothetical protein HMPREF9576_01996 [Cutibacterium acnes HL110PA2]EFS75558.1 hypothetical protein HMPREF9621_00037 [Cutibacterium modestum HL037PA2]EFS76091.1 hypothetical protein HMPREF9591_02129 [Cutibacterium acnes HL086PA1]EFS93771.1 hypothetical protein HMPREF9607_00030 [Cutibacterium modestum HL044PA1]EFT06607.1 hypothetical prote